mmetsp:Transcript_19388/g.56325  ORF Transcript_19388/g.56325 Transcript_19388/m.56325 type:complete len:276 (+) Transcript_19388:817-1644(+)
MTTAHAMALRIRNDMRINSKAQITEVPELTKCPEMPKGQSTKLAILSMIHLLTSLFTLVAGFWSSGPPTATFPVSLVSAKTKMFSAVRFSQVHRASPTWPQSDCMMTKMLDAIHAKATKALTHRIGYQSSPTSDKPPSSAMSTSRKKSCRCPSFSSTTCQMCFVISSFADSYASFRKNLPTFGVSGDFPASLCHPPSLEIDSMLVRSDKRTSQRFRPDKGTLSVRLRALRGPSSRLPRSSATHRETFVSLAAFKCHVALSRCSRAPSSAMRAGAK